jgi:amino acid adenylation domain-containing protein
VAQISFAIANESHGSRLSREGRREYEWEVSGMVSGNRLFMSVTYNKTHYKRQTAARLWEVFQEELLRLIRHCSAVKKRELTPSDLTYKKLSMEVLDGLGERYPMEDVYPLTSMQEGMLFHGLLDPASSAYFEQIAYRVHGNLQIEVVKKSLNELVKRHAVLRTAFIHEYRDLDRPLQVLLKHREVDFFYKDSRNPGITRDDREKQAYIQEFGKKDRQRSFNLNTDALFRVSILRVDDTEYELAWSFHHIVMDGWCTGILTREFLEIYTAFLENRGYRLPAVTPYRVYIQWLEKQDKVRSRDYWHAYLEHYDQPTGIPGGKIINRGDKAIPYQKEQVVLILESDKTEALNRLAGKNRVTLNTILQAVWGVILSKYSGKRDVVFGAVVSGRPPEIPGVESMVGLFIHTIPVRIKFDHTLRFRGLLQQVQQNTIASEPHHYYSLADIQSLSSLKQHLLDHIFVFENYPIAEQLDELFDRSKKTHEQAILRISNIEVFEQANYDFGIRVSPGRPMKIEFLYNGNVYNREIIERVSRHLNRVVRQVLEDEERYIHQLTLLSAEEKREVLIDFNETHMEFSPDKTIHGLFAEQVQRTPDNIAVMGMAYGEQCTVKAVGTRFIASDPGRQNVHLTYSLLDRRANQLAYVLIGKGVQTDTIVGIMVGRSVEMIIGLLAILKAGGAYLPIDPGYPEERITYMLKDSNAEILLKDNHFTPEAYDICPKDTSSHLHLPPAPATCLAYVIYTSGSTGKPKGVLIRHQGFVNLVYFHKNVFKESHRDRMSQAANPGFDAMGFEVWPCLLQGAALYIAHDEIRSDPVRMKEWLIKNRITISFQPTVMAEHLLKEEWPQRYAALRALRTAGDRLTSYPQHRYPFRFYNLYGPTEDTVWTTYTEVTACERKGEYPDIGKPIGNKRVYILDPHCEPQPVYIAGELCISGIGLAVGYLNNPGLTAEKFCLRRPGGRFLKKLPPWTPRKNFLLEGTGKGLYRSHQSYTSYIYRTGDLARWLPDGSIEFLGRVDHQVKLRGFRVEPGEIESRLLKHESICEAVVAAVKDKRGEKALCAYIVPVDTIGLEKTIDTPQLKEYLAQTLPAYMIPTYFVQLGKIPLTPNGKIDRNRLPAPQIESSSDAAPSHEKEAVIARIWQEVLQLEKVGIHDNFFDLGGNSMDIIRVNNRLKDAVGLDIPLVTLFRYPTVHRLYQYLTKGETGKHLSHETVGRRPAGLEKTQQEIAVIGMSGRFPGAKNIHEFWDNLKKGRESISFFTGEELEETGVEPDMVKRSGYVKARAFLEEKEYFDASFFGYVPTEAEVMDPQLRIFHECAWEALENAGYNPGSYDGMIGLYAGASNNFNWEALAYLAGRHTTLGQFALGQLTNKDFLSSRISYKLDLKGPVVSVQTACSTSLVAIHMACRALISGECDMAMAGGITILGIKKAGYLYQEGMIMSPDGHCRAFAARAKGTVSGEGAGIVVLKPLKKAMAEGDHIYALVKGTAINNDGMGRVGFSAPGVEGQAQVIRTAQNIAGVEAESITYIETHGTATEIGDPIEIEALKLAFNTDKKGFCALGSVKTNVGHLDCAAGAAGFIKIVLALTHRCIPPSLHFEAPNPAIDFKNSPFYVNTEPKEWNNPGYPLRAGVSSFGIGGTNAHVILEESPGGTRGLAPWPDEHSSRQYQLILLSAKTPSALDKMTGNLVEYLKKNPGLNLPDAAYTLQVGRRSFHHRRMLVVFNSTEAIEALSSLDPGKVKTARVEERDSRVCFMFAGLGSQYVNMGRELYEKEPIFRQEMNRCFEILNTLVDYDIKEVLYPHPDCRGGSPYPPKDCAGSPLQSDQINQAETAQVVIFIFEYALAKLLLSWGIQPHAMIGYSFGEYTAACIAGVFSLECALELVVSRGQLLNKIPGGSMLSVPLDKGALKPLLPEELSLSIDNGPSCIVSGTNEAVHAFEKSLKKKGYISMRLQSSRALHSHMMEPILTEFEKEVRRFALNKPNIPYISNVTGNWISDEQAVDPGYWSNHLRKTVRFADGVQRLLEEPANLLVEIGPGHDLTALMARFTGDNRKTINLVRPPGKEVSDIYYLLNRIGRLWLYYGKEMHRVGFYQGEKRYRVPLPTYPFERQPYWLPGHTLGEYAETLKDRSPVPAARALADWFYIPTWSLSAAPLEKSRSSDVSKVTHTWLVMLDNDDKGIGSLLVTRLRSSGHQVVTVKQGVKYKKAGIPGKDGYEAFTINPGEIGHYGQLFRELQLQHTIPHRVVHFWSLNRDRGIDSLEPGDVQANREAFEKAQHSGFYSLLHLAVQLSGSGSPGTPGPMGPVGALAEGPFQVTAITNQLLEVTGEEELSPEKATLLGAIKVIPQEHPNIRCRCIDIGLPAPRSLREEKLIEHLWEELVEIPSDSFPDTVMAIRGDYRWVRTYTPLRLEEPGPEALPLKEKGVYLVTGGLGNIGYTLAEYLAQKTSGLLILIGRSFCPMNSDKRDQWLMAHPREARDPGNPVNLRIQKVRQLEALGAEVLVFGADVSNLEQMRAVIDETGKKWGNIDGVIHAAGIVRGGSVDVIEKLGETRCWEQFKPKVAGTLVLENLLQGQNLDFCWMMSSISAVLGGLRFAAYSAANCFIDAWVKKHNRMNRKPWKSVNWEAMEPRHTREVFERVLSREKLTRVVVAKGGNLQDRIDQWIKLESLHKETRADNEDLPVLMPRPDLMSPYVEPRTPVEQTIVDTWKQLFGFEQIGVRDDFFELGGDSLKAITVIARMHKALGVEVPLPEFFKRLTIENIAEYINHAEKITYSLVEPAETKEYYVLSSAQGRMYILHRLENDSLGYNETRAVLLEGDADKNRFQRALHKLIRKHEGLRTSFIEVNETPVQRIHDEVEFHIEYLNENHHSSSIIHRFVRPFDLSCPPLFRAALIKTGENTHVLVFDIHHIITDGISHEILIKDFMTCYAHDGETSPARPTHARLQYKDYAEWRHHDRQQQALEKQEKYWLGRFKGEIPILYLPYDYPRPEIQGFAGSTITFFVGKEETQKMQELASKEEVSLFMLLLAVLNVFLSRTSGQEDIIVGTGIAGRRHENLQGIIGLFVNTLPLRNYPNDDKPFTQFLREIKNQTLEAFSNQDYPFEDLVEKISVNRDPGRNPLFDILLMFQNLEIPALEIPGLRLKPYRYEKQVSKFDITFTAFERDEEIHFSCEYSTKLFKEDTIQGFINLFKRVVSVICRKPGKRIGEIEILSEQEKRRLLFDMNQTGAEYPRGKTLHALFEEQVERIPDQVALLGQIPNPKSQIPNKEASFGQINALSEGYLTYSELDERSNRLARVLIEKGVQTDTIVGIMMDHCKEMVIGILGILKAGGAYMPMDPQYPEERINYMLADSSAKVLVTSGFLAEEGEKVRRWQGEKIFLEPGYCQGRGEVSSPASHQHVVFCQVRPANLAYVIYTSGTTGRPKGVMITHLAAVNYIYWAARNYVKDESVDFPLFTSISFDLTVTSIFTPLGTGNTIVVYGAGNRDNIIERIIDDNRVGVIKLTPAHLSLIRHKRLNNNGSKLSIKRLVLGGEKLETRIVHDICKNFNGNIEIYNEYGPTEATVGCMIYKFDRRRDRGRSVPIGGPAANTRIYLLDKNQQPVPAGITGEIYISGTGVAAGYLNRPDLTSEVFIINPFLAGSTCYRTADLARRRPDGNIEFLGRLDQQVKIRGFRVELEEIQHHLLYHEEIKEAVVTAREDKTGEGYLCAYIVSNRELDPAGLREFLSHQLPGYMIPPYFVQIGNIPLTPNGKVNQKALPEPEIKSGMIYNAPRDAVEKKLAAIWLDVLGLIRNALPASPGEGSLIGIDDNFFQLGGHSLKATRLTSKIHREFKVKIPLAEVFKTPSIRSLAAYIKKAGEEEYGPIKPAEEKEYYELSSAQKRLYFIHQVEPGSLGYNMSVVLAVKGEIDLNKLKNIFARMMRRHESLRTSFMMVKGEPVQKVHYQVEVEIEYDDLQVTGEGDRCRGEEEPFEQISAFIRPFDLAQVPLLRVGLIKEKEQEYVLMVDMHHIISDGMSMRNLAKEFMTFYTDPGRQLPPLTLRYKDFAQWQNKLSRSTKIKEQENYWTGCFKGEIPVLQLPFDYPRPPVFDFEGEKIGFSLDEEATAVLKRIALEADASLFMLLLTVYTIFLRKLSGQEDIVVGVPAAGRSNPELEPVIGMFINTLALRNFPTGEKTFLEFLNEVKENSLQAFENQDYQFETLVEKVVSQRPSSGNPLFDTMFVLQNNEDSVPQTGEQKKIPRLDITPYGYTNKTSRFDITLEASDRDKTLWVSIEYRTALFNKETIERFTGYFKQAVSFIRQNPTKRLKEIEIIPGEEKKKLLEDFSHTPIHFPGFKDKTIQGLFEEQAGRTPDHAALLGKEEGWKDRRVEGKKENVLLTYKELNKRSDGLAYLLKEKGVGPDIIVGIMMERSVEMIVGILGILKAGGAYLPIDPGYPGKRIEYMLTGSASKILVTTPGLSKEIEFANDIIFVPTSPHLPFPPSPLPSLHLHLSLAPVTSLVYVIYTSGSTGRPKGVLIQHRSLVNMVWFHREIFGENFQSRISQVASVSFDAMAFEIWPCLLAGGVLCIVDNETRMDPWQLKEWLIKHQITISFQTTRMAQQLLAEQWPKTGTALKALRAAGDRLTVYPTGTYPFRFYNLYGPTEDTIWTTWTEVTVKPRQESQPPSIGKPVANKQVYILSRSLKLQPVGIAGELCISGVGLARGYLNRPEFTAEKFDHDLWDYRDYHDKEKKKEKKGTIEEYNQKFLPGGPGGAVFSKSAPPGRRRQKIYKTGDLVRWLVDGTIEFLGRIDFQVKIRGFRIELGEIENQLLKHQQIKDVIVIDKTKKSGEKYLCAYFVGEKELEVSPLRHSLTRELPDYMVPTHFIQVKEMPLTPNGKIDRERLPSPGLTAGTGYVAPKSDDEKIIARVWKEVLELDRVGADDNFFELGGNSLNFIKINTRLKEVFERDIPVVYMFKYPTVRSFAHYLQQEDYNRIIRRSTQQQKGKTRVKNIRGRKKQARGI